MSTAIVAIYTEEGFVFAADGKCEDDVNVQKLFPAPYAYPDAFAFSLDGWGGLHDEEATLHVDFLDLCQTIVKGLSPSAFNSLAHYGKAVTVQLNEAISSNILTAINEGQINLEGLATLQAGRLRLTTTWVGYFRGVPDMCWFDLMLTPSTSTFRDHLNPIPLTSNLSRFSASAILRDRYLSLDDGSCVDSYRTVASRDYQHRPVSLVEALEVAINYIRLCSDEAARSLDAGIPPVGGRTLAATITPAEGFRWQADFEPQLSVPLGQNQ
jgi:hypothetical protein